MFNSIFLVDVVRCRKFENPSPLLVKIRKRKLSHKIELMNKGYYLLERFFNIPRIHTITQWQSQKSKLEGPLSHKKEIERKK